MWPTANGIYQIQSRDRSLNDLMYSKLCIKFLLIAYVLFFKNQIKSNRIKIVATRTKSVLLDSKRVV